MTSNNIILEDIKNIFNNFNHKEQCKDCSILISGANGFIPSYLVYFFLYLNFIDKNTNIKIYAIVRNLTKAKKQFSHLLFNKNLVLIEQDICDPLNITTPIDYIIHAASQASPKYYGIDPVGTLKPNIIGTMNLLELAKKNNIKNFVFFSSGEVYGIVPENLIPTKEDNYGFLDPLLIRSCYAESKRMGENICLSYSHQYGIPVNIIRPFHTYGPGIKSDDGRVYADFIYNILNNQNIKMFSDGSATRSFCYLADATLGFLTVLFDGKKGEVYNVGNPDCEISILKLAEILVNLYPEKNLKVENHATKDDISYLKSPIPRNAPNIDKIKKLLWQPTTSIQNGFKRTIESYL